MGKKATSGKQLLKNTIKSTDAQNKLAEQEECWRLRERGRSLSPLGRTIQQRLLTFTADPSAVLGSMKSISRAKAKKAEEEREKTKKRKKKSRTRSRSSSRGPRKRNKINKYLEKEWESPPRLPNFNQHDDRARGGIRRDFPTRSQVSPGSAREAARKMKLDAINKGKDRWDHSGFQDMYPTDFQENQNQRIIDERRQRRANKNKSSGTDSRSSSSSRSRSRSKSFSPPPSRRKYGSVMIGPSIQPSQPSIQKRLMEQSTEELSHTARSIESDSRRPTTLSSDPNVRSDIAPRQTNKDGDGTREKVKLRFKDSRRPKMAIRAKLPENATVEPEAPAPKPATVSSTAMTPGVVTMNTKMTKSLRKALKKKQKEKEKQERLENQKREEKQRRQEEAEALLKLTEMAKGATTAPTTNGEVIEEQVDQPDDVSGETSQGDSITNKLDINQGKSMKVDSSYWDYLNDLDEEDLGLEAKCTSEEEEEGDEESNQGDESPDVIEIAIQPPMPLKRDQKKVKRRKQKIKRKKRKRSRRHRRSSSMTETGEESEGSSGSEKDDNVSHSSSDRDSYENSAESEDDENGKRKRRRRHRRHRSSKRRNRSRKSKRRKASRGGKSKKRKRRNKKRSRSRSRSSSRSRTRSRTGSRRSRSTTRDSVDDVESQDGRRVSVSPKRGERKNVKRSRKRDLSWSEESRSRSRSTSRRRRRHSGSRASRSYDRSRSVSSRGTERNHRERSLSSGSERSRYARSESSRSDRSHRTRSERSGSGGSHRDRSESSESGRNRRDSNSRDRSPSVASESSRYSDFVRQSFKEVLMEK